MIRAIRFKKEKYSVFYSVFGIFFVTQSQQLVVL